eukprot:3066346-Amphidinium_carterae.1
MTDVEVTTLLFNGFQWQQFPLKRLKATATGSAVWLVGALEPSKILHQQLGEHLVTVEPATAAETQRKKNKLGKTSQGGSRGLPHKTSWQQPAQSSWDDWAAARSAQNDPESWWAPRSQRSSIDKGDPWKDYAGRPAPVAAVEDAGAVKALEQRITRIEKASTEHTSQISAVTSRLGRVESEVTSLGTQMQANFDRLFASFESRATDQQEHHRKAPRLDDSRGGSISVVDYGELDLDPSMGNFDVLGLGEANHTKAEMHGSRFIPTEGTKGIHYHLHWTPPTRVAGAQTFEYSQNTK